MKKLLIILLLTLTSILPNLKAEDADFVYSTSWDGTIKKIDSTGNEVWTFNLPSGIARSENITLDFDGNIYAGDLGSNLRKIDSSGNQVWNFTGFTDRVNDVAVDLSGNVYGVSNDNTIRKLDSLGNELWSISTTFDPISITKDVNGFIYVGFDNSGEIKKIDPNGNIIWTNTDNSGSIKSLITDKNGFIYSAEFFGGNTVRKFDNNGNLIWTFTGHSSVVYGVSVDLDGNVYSASADETLKKISSTGNEIWSYSAPDDVRSVSVDENSNIYIGLNNNTVKKLNSSGNEVWTFTGHSDFVDDVEVSQYNPLGIDPEPPEYNVELQTNTPYNDFIYQDDEVNVTTDSVITTILNDESFTVTSTAQSIGSYSFNYWYDLDNMEIFTTNRNFTIPDPDRDYNLIADYTLDSFNTFNIDSNLPSPEDFTFNTFTLENQPLSFNQNEFNNYQHPDDRDWEIIAPITNIGFYEFDYYYDNDANDIYDFNNVITGAGFSPPNLTAVYSLPEEYQINLIIESGIGDIIFQHGENDPISGPFISQTIGLGDDWTATAPSNVDYQFRRWLDIPNQDIFSENETINISNTQKDYYLEAIYFDLVDINWDSNGGTQIPQQTVVINSSIQPPPEPTRPGFVFDYWEDSNNNQVIFPKTITEDVTFTAVWIETYNLIYDTNGGGQINPDTYLENEVPEVVTPSRFGYEFDGWYTDDNTFQNEYDFTDPITVDTTIHAKWQFGSDRDASLSLTTFLDDNDLGDGFSQIIIMTALYIFINVMIYVYSGPLVVTLILNFILSSIFLILGWIPMWIIIVIFIGLFGFIYLSSSGRGATE